MPTFRFPDDDFQRMTAYLAGAEDRRRRMASGRDLQGALRSAATARRATATGQMALVPRPVAARPDQGRLHELEAARRASSHSIQEGVAGTSMPAWGKVLKSEQVNGVLELRARHLHQGAARAS